MFELLYILQCAQVYNLHKFLLFLNLIILCIGSHSAFGHTLHLVTLFICYTLHLSHFTYGQNLHCLKFAFGQILHKFTIWIYITQSIFYTLRRVPFCMGSHFALSKTLNRCFWILLYCFLQKSYAQMDEVTSWLIELLLADRNVIL